MLPTWLIGKKWEVIDKCFDQNNVSENKNWIELYYTVGQQVLLIKDGILCKAECRHEEPYVIMQVHCNGTVRIQCGNISEQINIR